MSNDIENKVVKVTFDNANFARKMEETIKDLERFNKSLKMAEGVKGMADAQKQVNSFKMDGVVKSVADAQGAMGKFNATPVVNAVADAQSAVNNFDAVNMVDQADKISAKWVAMAAGIFAVVSGLVTQISGKLSSIGQSFTLGPLKDGFSEYQTNVGAIQTILANTDRFGTKLPEVTANLDELNEYSDKTIYNFGEMVKNIGLFTNAGIRVGDATSMIKGFSNAAAASGTTAEGAAGAAYQLSQALSNGTVRLMDWRSLTNVGMGNKNMQQGIIELADSMGTLDKAGLSSEDVTAHFTDTLEKGWLSADVMSNYLKIMAGDMSDAELATLGLDKTQIEWFKRQQKIAEESATKVRTFTQLISTVKESIGSGWSETFRTVIGDFEQATNVFTGINNTISGIVGKSAQARNDLLRGWDFLGGRNAVGEGFVRIWVALLAVVKPVQEAFRTVFPKTTATQLASFSDRFRNFTKTLMPAKDTIKAISSIFKGFFSIIKIGTSVIWEVGKLIVSVFRDAFGGATSGGIVPFAAKLGDVITSVSRFLSEGGRLKNFFAALRGAIHHVLGPFKGLMQVFIAIGRVVGGVLGAALSIVIGLFRELFGGVAKQSKGAADTVAGFLDKITRGMIYAVYYINEFGNKLRSSIGIAKEFASGVKDIPGAFKQLKAIFLDRDFVKGPFAEDSTIVSSLFTVRDKLAAVKDKILELKDAFVSGFKNPFSGIENPTVTAFITKVGDAFTQVWGKIKDFASGGVAIFDGIKKSITDADWFGMLKDVGRQLYESFMAAIDAHSPSRMFMDAALAIPMGIAEGIKNGWDNVKSALQWMGDKLGGVFEKVIDFVTSPKLTTALKNGGLFALFKMGLNLSGLFGNLKGMAKQLKTGMKQITDTMDVAKDTFKSYQKSLKWKSLERIAISIGLLAASMIAMSFIDPAKLAQGVGGVTVALIGITTSMRSMDKMGSGRRKLEAMATTIRKIAEAILVLAFAVKLLGDMKDRGNLAQGLIGVDILMADLAGAIKLMDGQKLKMVGVASTLMGLAVAILILTFAVKTLGKMNDKGDLAQGLLAVGILLAGLGASIRLMGSPVELSGVAISLLAISVSMILLARAVKSMAELDDNKMKQGLWGLALGLGIIIGALFAIKKLNIEKASLGLLLMAFALKGIAKAVGIFGQMKGGDLAKGLGAMVIALAAIVAAMYVAEGAALGAPALLVTAYAMLVLADAVKKFSELKLGDAAKGLGLMVASLLALGLTMALLGFLSPLIGAFGAALVLVGIGVLAFGAGAWLLANAIKHLVEAGGDGLDMFMHAMDVFVAAMPHWLGVLGDAVVQGLKHLLSGAPELIDMLGVIIGKLLDVARKNLPKLMDVLDEVLRGLIKLVSSNAKGMVTAGIDLFTALMDGLGDNAETIAEGAVNMILGLMDGFQKAIDEHSQEIGDKGRGIGKSILDAIVNVLVPESLQEAIGNVVTGMVDWFKNLLGIQSPSTVFAGFGGDILQGLINGLGGMLGAVLNFFISLPGKIFGALGNLLSFLWSKGSDLISGLWNGAKNIWNSVYSWVTGLAGKALAALGNTLSTLTQKGRDLLQGLWNGAKTVWSSVYNWLTMLGGKIRSGVGQTISMLTQTGRDVLQGLWNGLKEKWEQVASWFTDKMGWLGDKAASVLKLGSPSKLFKQIGRWTMEGFHIGLEQAFGGVEKFFDSMGDVYDNVDTDGLFDITKRIKDQVAEMDGVQPTIAPVIDLSNVKMGVDAIGSMMDGASIDAGVSLDNARLISSATSAPKEEAVQPAASSGGVTFIQNIHSPRALSEADIYRNTNGQVARASKELGIAS